MEEVKGMSGWKSKIAGFGGIATGIGLIISGCMGDSFDIASIKQGIAAILAGIGVLGIAHKIEKAGADK